MIERELGRSLDDVNYKQMSETIRIKDGVLCLYLYHLERT